MKKFKQISKKPGFLKNNGGLLLRQIKKDKYEFKTVIKKIHLNRAKITHGGYICSIIDAGAGTAAHLSSGGKPCVTISLEIKFIAQTKLNDKILGKVSIDKVTNSLVFLKCTLESNNQIIATSSGIWKILKHKIKDAGYGG
jgi:acyl-coenzyme A thioesterase PaaI-like protein|tara:strand:+ start:621 stop:1043 length:423 start_codon:yes stop_codon:yes gene_type:complete